jgi:ABC-type amino acid transport substrate-binding protein
MLNIDRCVNIHTTVEQFFDILIAGKIVLTSAIIALCFWFLLLSVFLLGITVVPAAAEPTLEKIKNSGVFTIGVRNASPPFSFINKQNERAGFANDLAMLVHKNIEKKLGMPINLR